MEEETQENQNYLSNNEPNTQISINVISDEDNDKEDNLKEININEYDEDKEAFGAMEYDEINEKIEQQRCVEQQINDLLSKELEEEIKNSQVEYKNLLNLKEKKEENKKKLLLEKNKVIEDYERLNM